MTGSNFRRPEWVPAAVLAAMSLLLYGATLEPGLLGGDSAEAQFVPHLLGIPHFTGYPLFTLFGKLWTLLVPLGEAAWRMNLLSAVMGAASVGLVYLALREVPVGPATAVLGASLYGVVPLVWFWSTRAGVRAMHLFFVALVLWLALRWARGVTSLSALALAVGLSLAHHRTTILLLPGLALLVAARWRRERPARPLAALVLPLLLYLYLPIRSAMDPPYAFARVRTVADFWGLVSASSLRGYVLSLSPAEVPGRMADLWQHLAHQFGAVGALAGLAGLVLLAVKGLTEGVTVKGQAGVPTEKGRRAALGAKARPAALVLVPSWLLMAGFTVVYRFDSPDLNVNFLLPAHLVLAMGVAAFADELAGLAGLAGRTRGPGGALGPPTGLAVRASRLLAALRGLARLAPWTGRLAVPLLGAALLAAPVARGWELAYRGRQGPLDPYREVLRGGQAWRLVELGLEGVAPRAIIVADWEQAAAFFYAQLVEGVRPDVTVRYPVQTNLGWTVETAGDRPVYLARLWPGLGGEVALSAEGPLIRLYTQAAPEGAGQPVGVFGQGLGLAGFEVGGARDGIVPIRLEWVALRPLPDLSVSLQAYDGAGRLAAQQDHADPVMGAYSTSQWPVGRRIGDYFELPVGGLEGLRLGVVVYRRTAEGFENWPTGEGGEILWLGGPGNYIGQSMGDGERMCC